MERKELAVAVTDVDDSKGIIETIAAVTGNVDDGLDRIMPGAFGKTLQERGARAKVGWQHSLDHPLGKTIEAEEVGINRLPAEVLKLAPEAKGGLRVVGQVSMTPTNRERLQLIKDGVVDGASIGYDAMQASFSNEDGRTIRNLHEIRLWEWSPVTFGMNAAARIVGVKSLDKAISGSFEDLGQRVADTAREAGMFTGTSLGVYCSATFSDHVIVRVYTEEEQGKSFRVGYSFGPNGEVILGDSVEVEVTEIVEPKARAAADIAALAGELKAGRMISARNMERLRTAMESLMTVMEEAEASGEEGADKAATSTLDAAPALVDWLDIRMKDADVAMLFNRARLVGAL